MIFVLKYYGFHRKKRSNAQKTFVDFYTVLRHKLVVYEYLKLVLWVISEKSIFGRV